MKYFSVFFLALLLTASIAQDACARPRTADMFEDTVWDFSARPWVPSDGLRGEDMFSVQPVYLSGDDVFGSFKQTRYYTSQDMFEGRLKPFIPPYSFFADRVAE